MNAMVVVIMSELVKLALQVDCVPDQHVVEKLPSYRSDQPFHKRMGYRHQGDRLDLRDLDDAQIGTPTMEPE